MGCSTSKEKGEVGDDTKKCRPRSLYRPAPPVRPPTPPLSTPNMREPKASNAYLENPQRKWQRRQMGGELFESAKITPKRTPTLPEVEWTPLQESLTIRSSLSGSNAGSARNEATYPPGTALPYMPEPNPPTTPEASSVYSDTPTTSPNQYHRSHSYRSYSGRMMYSPSRFPVSSSPYGTPTIRTVPRSTSDIGHCGDTVRQDEDAKAWLTETSVDEHSLEQLGLQGIRQGHLML